MEMDDAKPRDLGGSLPVPNVQDLAAHPDHLTPAVLHRYLRPRPNTDEAAGAGAHDDKEGVPVVDLGRILDPELAEEEAAKLKFACEDWGFFQVVNHGIPEEIVEEMKGIIKGFFELPLAEKEAFAQQPGGIEGYGQAFVVSEEQKLDWGDMYFLVTQPPHYRNLDLWSSRPSTFRSSLECYSAEVQRVAGELLRAMARNLGVQDPEKMTRIAGQQTMRINYYPPCPQAHDRVWGLSPHSDAVGLTLLLQVNPVAGLHIRRKGRWVPVKPLPGALVANIGDVIEVLTNGKYKSIEHRAVVSAHEERMSVAAFHTAKFGATYGPLEEIVGGDAVRYRTMSVEDYLKLILSSKLDGKNTMDAMKINHPGPRSPGCSTWRPPLLPNNKARTGEREKKRHEPEREEEPEGEIGEREEDRMILAVLFANSDGNILIERFHGVPAEERLHWRSFLVKLGSENLKGAKNKELLVASHKSVSIVYTMTGDVCLYIVGKDEYDELALSEVIFAITSAVTDVCGKPPTERLFLDKYGRICLCLDEIVWKGLLENTEKDRVGRLIRLKPPVEP